jgi:WD40 repeat protein/Flp pilus assembly protein TadD
MSDVAFAPDGRRLFTTAYNQGARRWDLQAGEPALPPLVHGGIVWWAAFSPDGSRIATASADGSARLWDARTHEPATEPLRHQRAVRLIRFSGDGRRVLTASEDGVVRVRDAASGAPVIADLAHPSEVMEASFVPGGNRILTACKDGLARVWDIAAAGVILTVRHGAVVYQARFSPDGGRLLTAGADGTARLWDARSGDPLGRLMAHRQQKGVVQALFSTRGNRILTASQDETARVWDGHTGEPITPPLRHAAEVRVAAWGPDERRVLTASLDGTARVWDAVTGQPLSPPLRDAAGPVHHACFSPDGSLVATGGYYRTVRVWDAGTGEAITPPWRHAASVEHVEFSPDGRLVVSASQDGTARVWEVPAPRRPLAEKDRLALVLSSRRLDDTGSLARVDGAAVLGAWKDLERDGTPDGWIGTWEGTWNASRVAPDAPLGLICFEDHSLWQRVHDLSIARTTEGNWRLDFACRLADGTVQLHTGHVSGPPAEGVLGDRIEGTLVQGSARQDWSAQGTVRAPGHGVSELDLVVNRRRSKMLFDLGGARLDPGSSPAARRAWHERGALAGEAAWKWSAALTHLGFLVDSRPADPGLRARRGWALAELGQYREAAADYARAIEAGDASTATLLRCAILFLAVGDADRHRELCAVLRQQVSEEDHPRIGTAVAVHGLASTTTEDSEPWLALARRHAQNQRRSESSLRALGIALIRAGRPQEAIPVLEEVVQSSGEDDPFCFSFLSLANQALGQSESARAWLEKAEAWLARPPPSWRWTTRLQNDIVHREARERLRGP